VESRSDQVRLKETLLLTGESVVGRVDAQLGWLEARGVKVKKCGCKPSEMVM